MSPTKIVTLTDELHEQASREAQAEGKTVDEITRDALSEYLVLLRRARLQEGSQKRYGGATGPQTRCLDWHSQIGHDHAHIGRDAEIRPLSSKEPG